MSNEPKDVHEQESKLPYTKPELKIVELRPEEAVLGFCRGTGAGPGGSTCTAIGTPCSSNGS